MDIILRKPVVSEKSMKLAKAGLYTFLVSGDARKPEIEREVEQRFRVDVIAVKTANFKGRSRLQRSRKGYFMVAGFKKALVQLKKGQTIGLFVPEPGKVEESEESKGPKEPEVKEKKSLLKGTKVKIEKSGKSQESRVKNKKEEKKKGVKSGHH